MRFPTADAKACSRNAYKEARSALKTLLVFLPHEVQANRLRYLHAALDSRAWTKSLRSLHGPIPLGKTLYLEKSKSL